MNIIKRHPSHNGNKRTAWLALTTFLRLNDIDLNCSTQEAPDFFVGIATSQDDFDLLKEKVSH